LAQDDLESAWNHRYSVEDDLYTLQTTIADVDFKLIMANDPLEAEGYQEELTALQ